MNFLSFPKIPDVLERYDDGDTFIFRVLSGQSNWGRGTAIFRPNSKKTPAMGSYCRVAHASVRSWRNHWKYFIKRLSMYPWHQKHCLWCLVSVLSEYSWGKPLPGPDSGVCQKFQLKPWNHVLEIPQNPLIFHEPRKSFDFTLLPRIGF